MKTKRQEDKQREINKKCNRKKMNNDRSLKEKERKKRRV